MTLLSNTMYSPSIVRLANLQTVARDQYRVVGFVVQPRSKRIVLDSEGNANCDVVEPLVLDENAENLVVYTYSVAWKVFNTSHVV